MAILYTDEETQRVLRELRIRPVGGMVTTQEAARLLTWRAKAECGVEHEYTQAAVRRHVHTGKLSPQRVSARFNRYRVEDIFSLRLAPRRGAEEAA